MGGLCEQAHATDELFSRTGHFLIGGFEAREVEARLRKRGLGQETESVP